MWRSLIAVVLLHSLLAAQAVSAQSKPEPSAGVAGGTGLSHASQQDFHPFTFYDRIRRGRSEKVAIRLPQGMLVTTPTSRVAGVIPLDLKLQAEPGFTVRKLRYPKAGKQSVLFQSAPIMFAREEWIEFEIATSPEASLGQHVLTGKLTLQPVDLKLGAGPVQQVDVEIPINVVEHNAKANRNEWPIYRMSTGVIILLIVLAPIWIPLFPLLVACGLSESGGCFN